MAIKAVIANLIDNSLRAEPEGGVVLIRVNDNAIVEVIDHDQGIEERDRETIFEPFWRKSEITPGAGPCLAIAREVVSKHGRRLWVEETPGGGATFKVSLRPAGQRRVSLVEVPI